MNKYQQALNNCVNRWAPTADWNLLKALVEKATPKKPVKKKFNEATMWDCADYFVERNACPTCKIKIINKSDFCPCCGQALDWSEE